MKSMTVYVCGECGYKNTKWLGRCPSCGAWNSFEESEDEISRSGSPKNAYRPMIETGSTPAPRPINEETDVIYERSLTGIGEFDRVVGGGMVRGSVILLSGEPGIGKSTLLLQLFAVKTGRKILYVSGEESFSQIKIRAKRLGVDNPDLLLYNETDVTRIIKTADSVCPDFIIADSIQTLYEPSSSSAPGSIVQVKNCASALVSYAKSVGCTVLLVGHVNKEGGVSGPKVLEHIVDTVLHFEGDRSQSYRMIRAVKNRFGSTNEIGVFEMTEAGLKEVENPSEMLLSENTIGISGCVAGCVMEGTRPLCVEIQALVTPTVFPSARRNSNGVDYNRLCLIIAVLEKRLGLKFWENDVYINVTGGLRLDSPGADLAIALALISSITDRPVKKNTICFGELGLAGECRSTPFGDVRINESRRLGFETIVMSKNNRDKYSGRKTSDLVGISKVYELLKVLEPKKNDDDV